MDITEKALLVKLSISQWTARKYDPTATDEVIANHHASKDAGRFNKSLVDLDAVKTYQKAANEARTFHYKNTLPWGDDESRILPSANYLPYMEKMRKLKSDFEDATREFIDQYPGLIRDAERSLNGLFNPRDYPDQRQLTGKFNFAVYPAPLPDAGDFRVTLSQDEADRIRDEITSRTQEYIRDAIRDAWNRLRDAISHLEDKLKDKDAIFRDSLVGNVRELCEILPRLNVTGDPDLAQVIDEAAATVARYDPEDLRNDPGDREAAVTAARDILKKIDGYRI